MATKLKIERTVNLLNKRAGFEYELVDCYVAGMVLRGTEIKSIRLSKVSLSDSYCVFKGDELYCINLQISAYDHGTYNNHQPRAERKLLLNKLELRKLRRGVEEKSMTIVVRRLFINDRGLAKLEICLARGKKNFDKRETIKEKDTKRDLDRDLARRQKP